MELSPSLDEKQKNQKGVLGVAVYGYSNTAYHKKQGRKKERKKDSNMLKDTKTS